MNKVTKTFKKPYYVVIFISNLNKTDFLFNEGNLEMVGLAPKQPGFLGMDRGRMEDGLGFSISYWESLEAIELWRENQKHSEIQNSARKNWLSEYTLRTAKVEYDYYYDMNQKIEPDFKIEDQAMLYSYIAKRLHEYIPDDADMISRQIIKTMANERGKRMAQRCINDNRELNIKNFLLYSEWDNFNEYNVWKEYDVLEYSSDYCLEVDKELVRGFNPNIEFDITQFLTTEKSYCDFRWADYIFKDVDELNNFNKERETIKPKVSKDFLYHTAHLYSCAARTINKNVESSVASQILLGAIADYKKNFSTQKSDLIIEKSRKDFSTT